jgi:hypothetical protein
MSKDFELRDLGPKVLDEDRLVAASADEALSVQLDADDVTLVRTGVNVIILDNIFAEKNWTENSATDANCSIGFRRCKSPKIEKIPMFGSWTIYIQMY